MKRSAVVMTFVAASSGVWPALAQTGTPVASPPATTADAAPLPSFEEQLTVARAQARSGRLLLKKADYSGARPLLESAYAVMPDAQTLLELVQCYRALSLNAPALQLILQARAAASPELNPNEAKAVADHVAALEPVTSRLRLITPVPPKMLRVDGLVTTLPANAVPFVLEPGLHAVQIEAEGYEPYTKDVTTVAGKEEQVVAELQKWVDTGHLRVNEKSGQALEVTIDGQVVGQTPWEGDVPAGTHTISGRSPRAVAQAATIELPRRGQMEVTLEATVQRERVAFQVAPVGATVTLDGQRVNAPYDDHLLLGRHQLRIEAPGYAPYERLFELAADAPFVEGISLQPAAVMESPPETKPEPNPLRMGFLVGVVSLPRPINLELAVKPNDWFAVGVGFSMIPKIKVSNGAGEMSALNAVGRIFPFGGSFYVGAAAGRQSMAIEADDTIRGQHVTAIAEHATLFVTPQVGWLFVWDSGFTLGINVGAQISLSSTPKVRLRADNGFEVDPTVVGPDAEELRDNLRTAGKFLARYPLPTLDLLKLGFLF